MSVGSVGNEQRTNYAMPGVIGAVAGGAAGATFLAGSKYKTAEEIVNAINGEDKFELKAKDGATDEVKKAVTTTQDVAKDIKSGTEKVAEAFKDGDKVKESISFEEFLKAVGKENPGDKAAIEKTAEVAAKINNVEAGKTMNIEEALKDLFTTGEGEAKKFDAEAAKNFLKDTFKTGEIAADAKEVTITAEVLDNAKAAIKKSEDAKPLFAVVNDGKVTKEAAENFVKETNLGKITEDVMSQLKGLTGKARGKGAAIYGAIGLVAGLLVAKMMGGKSDKA